MKTSFFLFVALSISALSFSQAVAVAAVRFNILYVGVDNPLSIAVENVPTKSLIVKASKGTVTRVSGNHYIYHGSEPGEVDILVYKKEKGSLRELGKIPFRVTTFPDPTAFVGNLKGGKISKKTLIAMGGVIAKLENSDFEASARVDSFTVCILYKNSCEYKTFKNIRNKFNQQVLDAFKDLNHGDTLVIRDIYATWIGGTRELIPLLFTITDSERYEE